jgi:hypothetical protein
LAEPAARQGKLRTAKERAESEKLKGRPGECKATARLSKAEMEK